MGSSYAAAITATGRPAPTFAVTSGALPDGLALSAAGQLTGTPSAMGTFAFTVTASNAAGSDAAAYTIAIGLPATGGGAPPGPLLATGSALILGGLMLHRAGGRRRLRLSARR
jgi:hypothetical protein